MSTWQLVLTLSILAIAAGMAIMALFYLAAGADADAADEAPPLADPQQEPR